MTNIDASGLDYRQLNAAIRDCAGDAAVTAPYERFTQFKEAVTAILALGD